MQTPEEKRRYQAEYRRTHPRKPKPLTEQQKINRKAAAHTWYLAHADEQKEKVRQWRKLHPGEHAAEVRQHLAKKREWLRQMRSERGCDRCRITDPRVLDFHHRDPSNKEFYISNHVSKGIKTLLREAEKCDVLCSNCHRIVEWEKRRSDAA